MTNEEYRKYLIGEILKLSDDFKIEMLNNKPTRALERIYDNI